MLVTTNLFPTQPPLVYPDTLDPNDLDAFSDIEDDATVIVATAEPPTQEPEWMFVDPWTCEAIREYDARACVG